MSNPIVSVCLITYNHEKYIRQAIESILLQKVTFPWEVIIADDCSTDSTRAIVSEYYHKHPDIIRPLFQEKNVGGGKNFVDLINAAQGKYVAYLEGDDYWTDPYKLQKQFDLLEANPGYTLCYHKASWEFTYDSPQWKELGTESNKNDPHTSTIEDLFVRGWFIRSCSMFFRKIDLPTGFEKLHVGDYPLHIMLADKGKIGFINECMGTYRIHKEGFSEKNLLVMDYNKRKRNFYGEIFLNDFLNTHTEKRYSSSFEKKKFDILYSHMHFVFFNYPGKFPGAVVYAVKNFSPLFLLKYSFKKTIHFLRR